MGECGRGLRRGVRRQARPGRTGRRLAAACLLVFAATTSASAEALASSPPRPSAGAAAGCHPEWPVVAHFAGGQAKRPPGPITTPVACATPTGYGTSEPSLAATRTGALFFSPAHTENSVAVSSDGGRSWHLAYPPNEQYTALWNTDDPYLTADRRTGRLFWLHATGPLRTTPLLVSQSVVPGLATGLAAASGFQVYATPDDGRTWTTADDETAPTGDWGKIFVGPPPPRRSGAAQPTGYPDVVYVCANSPAEVIGPGRLCYKSLDGAASFEPAGYVFPSLSAPLLCPALATNTGVVASNGTIYLPVSCPDGSHVAISTDEGSSYRWVTVPGVPGSGNGLMGPDFQIAIDAANNLYAMWVANDHVLLSVSRNGARSWEKAMAITAPGVHNITLAQLAAGPAGDVGVAYYAGLTASQHRLTAYLTQTWDATGLRPLFVSAALNDPAHPIFVDTGLTGGSPRADYVGATYDPSGTLWAGVVEQLGPVDAHGNVATTGYVGRLVGAHP